MSHAATRFMVGLRPTLPLPHGTMVTHGAFCLTPNRANRKKWLVAAAKLAIVALVGWAVHRSLVDAWQQLGKFEWHLEAPWLVAAGVLYLLGLLPAGIFWHRVLRVLGQDAAAWRDSAGLLHRPSRQVRARKGHGRHPPHGPGAKPSRRHRRGRRKRLLRNAHDDGGRGVSCRGHPRRPDSSRNASCSWVAIGLMLVAGLPTIPPVFRRIGQDGRRGQVGSRPECEKLARLGYKDLLTGWVCMTVSWVILALSLWATFRSMGIDQFGPIEHLASYTACVSLAMVAGFLSLIPGGLGVRDAILLRLIAPLLPGRRRAAPRWPAACCGWCGWCRSWSFRLSCI